MSGGQGTWREFLTVPNLLKIMNPKLVGYSKGDGNTYSHNAQFNVAYSGAMDQDLIGQARRLITIMKNDKRVDYENHWKVNFPPPLPHILIIKTKPFHP